MNILNTLTKSQNKGIAVISTKTNGDVYEKLFSSTKLNYPKIISTTK